MELIVLEIVVGFGIPFAWGVWELVKLREEQRRDAEREAWRESTPSPERAEE